MSRDLFGIELGLLLFKENGDAGVSIIRGSDLPGLGQNEIDAAVGSLYIRDNGSHYVKKTAGSGTDKWVRQINQDDLNGISPRSEKIIAGSGDAAPVSGNEFTLPFSDDDAPALTYLDFSIGDHVLYGVGGVPKLMRVTALNSVDDKITVVDADIQLADNDYMIVQNYLVDSGDSQEKQAMVQYVDSSIIKIADFNWNFADGIGLQSGYSATTGDISSTDTVQSAVQKLDGNNDAQDSVLGTAQGASNLGSFTGLIISDNTNVKTALQELETEADAIRVLTGTALGSLNLGTFTGSIITSNTTVKTALQELETSIENINVQKKLTGITTESTIDDVLVDSYHASKWLITASLDSSPGQVKAYEVFAIHNGTGVADATSVDDTTYARLRIGAAFDVVVKVDLDGTGASQKMRLRVSASNAVTVRAKRVVVDF